MVTLKIAFRNLFLHKMKTAVIGSIIVFGTTLAIVGNSVVDAISNGMQRSLTESVTGEIQIYASEGPSGGENEKLSIFGNMDGSMPDIGHLGSFAKVRDALKANIPNIKTIIPMGTNFAMWSPGNILDVKLEDLRHLYNKPVQNAVAIQKLKRHIRAIIADVQKKMAEKKSTAGNIFAGDETFAKAPETLRRVLDGAFWDGFDAHAQSNIEFLGNSVAPLIFDETQVWLSYMGTVPGLFKRAFPQFEIVKGQEIPEGKRGFIFSEYVYETFIKNRVARRLDQIKKRLDHGDGVIAKSQIQRDAISACVAQAAEIYSQISPDDTAKLVPKLQGFLHSQTKGIDDLIREFLKLDDSNFKERYAFFYEHIAPLIILYKVRIGDVFPITAFSKSGYSSSVNMKVYGTYRFKSFESSPIAGNFSLMDMMSFRELFGFMTEEKRQETKALDAEMGAMGVRDVDSQNIDALFSQPEVKAPSPVKVVHPSSRSSDVKAFDRFEKRRRMFELDYTSQEMEDGVFLNAAVVLKDPSRIDATIRAIQEVSKKENLGIQAVSWRDAAGITGQLTIMVRAVLFVLMGVTFSIATFIIMNSMLMATLERTREIGTMRAIGAQRKFLLSLFFQETAILSFIFGAIGTVIGVAIIATVGAKGIPAMGDPAQGDVSTFFFSGDRLFLHVNPLHIFFVFACMTLVAVISTQYPAWRAMRISPLAAMQSKD